MLKFCLEMPTWGKKSLGLGHGETSEAVSNVFLLCDSLTIFCCLKIFFGFDCTCKCTKVMY